MEQLRDTFQIRTDTGGEITVNEYVELVMVPGLDEGPTYVDGMSRLVTEDGYDVTEMEDGTFHILATGQTGARV